MLPRLFFAPVVELAAAAVSALCAAVRVFLRAPLASFWIGALAFLVVCTAPAHAMRIVLTNDDGFEAANIQALFVALKAAGHDVVLSAPYQNVSGSSALIGTLSLADLARTNSASASGAIPSGAPGAGPTTLATDQYYVNSTPAAAVLYGIDVAGMAKWGAAPDLVISGPNEGNNLGTILPHASTIGAAVTALNRGIPSIAVNGPNGDRVTAPLLAQITLRVIAAITVGGKPALPPGTGLNINVPALDAQRSAVSYRVAFTRIGYSSNYFFHFVADPAAPTLPAPVDVDPSSETNAIRNGNVTVSPIQGTYQAAPAAADLVLAQMRPLIDVVPVAANATVAATLVSASPAAAATATSPRLINISMRGLVGTGANGLVAGFVINGRTPKTVLIRGSGPALTAFSVTGALADPMLELFDRTNRSLAANDNWCDDPTKTAAIAAAAMRTGAFAFPAGSKDTALLVTLDPGAYTVVLSGVGGTTGLALLEVYDVENN